jgi:phosphate transport system substrate-binding protein
MSVFGRVAGLGFAAAWLVSGPVLAIGAALDATMPDYRRVDGVAGDLSSVGSDTLANVMTLWAEAFKREYPNVTIQIQAAGSSTAPPALTEGTSSIGPMSRKMTAGEEAAFEARYGYRPGAVRVAADVLAVFVNRDNPVAGMTIPQVDAVFSSTRKCGYPAAVTKWGQLGLAGPWKDRPIQLYGRNPMSGTHGYFKEKAMCKGDYRTTVNKQPGSALVVQAVARSLNGIGYASIAYVTSSVRTIPLADKAGDTFVEVTPDNAITGSYPLTRFLYVYFNKHPNGPLPLLEKEFLTLVLSRTGQQVVVKEGYIPLSAEMVRAELAKLE